MRFISALLILPSITLAQDQQPLGEKVKGWFQKAQSYIPTSTDQIPNPVDAAAGKVEERVVHRLTLDNWKDVLQPSVQSKANTPEEWMVFITGENKTCYGLCDRADSAWKVSTIHIQIAYDPADGSAASRPTSLC